MGAAQVQPQTRLGRYELLARLATGGMGEIFLARLEGAAGFEKLYVVKRILPHLADDVRFRQMLISEARIAAVLSHANVCQVYELGETAGQLYIVMEYLEGVTLLPLLRRASRESTPLDLGLVAAVIQQAADGLHYAHELRSRDGQSFGIVHRDVTPANLFVTESGVVKVLDFGIAKAKGATATNTQTGTVKGKYAYMAPEQLRGATDIDRRVDVFALGVTLFEMLALRRLFQRKTDYLTFRAVIEEPIPDVRRYRPDAPEAIAVVVARALDRDPARRFESVRQLATGLLDALGAAGRRPWSQGELGDDVRTRFASDLGARSHRVASAVNSPLDGGASSRSTMPLIASPDEVPDDSDDDDSEFPPVETALAETPFVPPHDPRAVSPGSLQTDFSGGTPPPFAADSSTSGVGLQPLPVLLERAPRRRGWVWPVIAGAMFVVAGGALVVLWQTSKQGTPPAPVVISTPHPTHVEDDKIVVGGDPVPTPVPVPTPDPAPKPAPPPARHQTPYDKVIESRLPQINTCLHAHAETTVPTSATLQIDPFGTPTSVTLQPPSLNATPLGGCIHDVLSSAKFPASANPTSMTFPFHARSG